MLANRTKNVQAVYFKITYYEINGTFRLPFFIKEEFLNKKSIENKFELHENLLSVIFLQTRTKKALRGLKISNFRLFLATNLFFSNCKVGRIRPLDKFWAVLVFSILKKFCENVQKYQNGSKFVMGLIRPTLQIEKKNLGLRNGRKLLIFRPLGESENTDFPIF